MRVAVLTDIHANREAFEAVLAEVAGHAVDRIAILGDIVGYGADPEWCCDRAEALVAEGAICVGAITTTRRQGRQSQCLRWRSGRLTGHQAG